MAGALIRLQAARIQDAAAWAALAVALLLAPWDVVWDTAGLPAPDPAWPWMAGGAALALAAVALLRSRSANAVLAAAVADLAGASAIAAWLLVADPAGSRGTVVLGLVAAGLALQASFDVAMLLSDS